MGTEFDALYGMIMRSAKTTGEWESWSPARREQYAGDMSVKVQNYLNAKEQAALTEGLSGQKTSVRHPVVTNTESPTTPAQVSVATQTKTTNKSKIEVVKKFKVDTKMTKAKYYLVDRDGTTYQVDRKTYRAAAKLILEISRTKYRRKI